MEYLAEYLRYWKKRGISCMSLLPSSRPPWATEVRHRGWEDNNQRRKQVDQMRDSWRAQERESGAPWHWQTVPSQLSAGNFNGKPEELIGVV